QVRHLPKEEGQKQRANVRTVDVRIGHDDDATVTQLRYVKAAFFLFAVSVVAVFTRSSDAGADRGDHRLDLGVSEKLIFARFLDIDQLAANRQDRLITSIASLFGRAAGGITLDDVKLGQFRIALGAVREFSRQSAAGKRAFANCLARSARG